LVIKEKGPEALYVGRKTGGRFNRRCERMLFRETNEVTARGGEVDG
jgi:hypothetical protein